jgi:hypothetical protein
MDYTTAVGEVSSSTYPIRSAPAHPCCFVPLVNLQ